MAFALNFFEFFLIFNEDILIMFTAIHQSPKTN